MLYESPYQNKDIKQYKDFLTPTALQKLLKSADSLKGKKIVHINTTPTGGGVAEMLKSEIPLMRSLGLDAHWYYFDAEPEFFEVTKKLHNSLQGSKKKLTKHEQNIYTQRGKKLAEEISDLSPDILILHDPQPLAAAPFLPGIPLLCRMHGDLTAPNPASVRLLAPLLEYCSKVFFTAKKYVPKFLPQHKVVVSPPAIDPLAPKNISLSKKTTQSVLKRVGLDYGRPKLVQVARFDPWKNPFEVLQTFRLLKKKIPDLQLVLAGVIEAQDDPEAVGILKSVKTASTREKDVFLFHDLAQLNGVKLDTFVNALQRNASVVIHRSTREGFGLAITEAMWKNQPVIGGTAAGIKLQIQNGKNGFITKTVQQTCKKALELLQNPALKTRLGKAAHKTVLKHFLITRMLEDELPAMTEALKEHLASHKAKLFLGLQKVLQLK